MEISSEFEQKENQSIILRLHRFLAEIPWDKDNPQEKSRSYDDKNNPEYRVDLSCCFGKNPSGIEPFGHVPWPPEFQPPVFALGDDLMDLNKNTLLYTSPYGNLPFLVAGADEKLYIVRNIYLFDGIGQATKFEEVFIFSGYKSLAENLAQWGINADTFPKLDFIPKEDVSRYVNLTGEDYEKIEYILSSIEHGDFIPS